MYEIITKGGKSAKGNYYLAITGYNNGEKVSNICLFEGQEFHPYGKGITQGQRNLWDRFIEKLQLKDGQADMTKHEELSFKAGGFIVAITDIATVGGVPVGADGLYLVKEGKIYTIQNPEWY